MFKHSKKYFLAVVVALAFGIQMFMVYKPAPAAAMPLPSVVKPVYFAAVCDYGKTFFGLPVWYKYLKDYEQPDTLGRCHFDLSKPNGGNAEVADTEAFVLIGLAIADLLLRLVGIIAVAFVIIGGVKYVLSQGEPDRTRAAKGTIINAFIGLVIAIVAAAAVAFIGKQLGP